MTQPNPPASPPCLAAEFDPAFVDPEQARDVARWRSAERQRLLTERTAMPVEARHTASHAIADHLDRLLSDKFPSLQGLTISAWWPIKAELNLRAWLDRPCSPGRASRPAHRRHQGCPADLPPLDARNQDGARFLEHPRPRRGVRGHPRHHPCPLGRLGCRRL